MKVSVLIAISALLFGSATMAGAEDSSYRVIKKVHIGGEGGWDYLTLDSVHHKLFVARSNRVLVVDTEKGKVVSTIMPNGESKGGIHGVALVPNLNTGFFTCGRDGMVRTFDLTTFAENGSITVGEKPDAILYDDFSKQIFCFNHGGKTVSVIDPTSHAIKATIELGGEPESGVSDGNGRIFVNIEDKNEVVAIDATKLAATDHWSLGTGAQPTGLAIDRDHHLIFSGCHNQQMVIIDTQTGKVVGNAPIGAKVDGCAFDPKSQNAFSSNGDGTVTVVHEDSPTAFHMVENVPTEYGARTMVLDPNSHKLYLASAVPETKEEAKVPGRPRAKLDSFQVLIVGQ